MQWLDEAKAGAKNWLRKHPLATDMMILGGLAAGAIIPLLAVGIAPAALGAILQNVSGIPTNILSGYAGAYLDEVRAAGEEPDEEKLAQLIQSKLGESEEMQREVLALVRSLEPEKLIAEVAETKAAVNKMAEELKREIVALQAETNADARLILGSLVFLEARVDAIKEDTGVIREQVGEIRRVQEEQGRRPQAPGTVNNIGGSQYTSDRDQFIGNEVVHTGGGSVYYGVNAQKPKLSRRARELFWDIADKLMNGSTGFYIARGNNKMFFQFRGGGGLERESSYAAAFSELVDANYIIPPRDGKNEGSITGPGEELYEEMRQAES